MKIDILNKKGYCVRQDTLLRYIDYIAEHEGASESVIKRIENDLKTGGKSKFKSFLIVEHFEKKD
jgi:hypothetical protein